MSWIRRFGVRWLLRNSHLTAAEEDATWVFSAYRPPSSFRVNKPGSSCANQYRSLDGAGPVLFESAETAYDACALNPFSVAPNRIADNRQLFPVVARA
ncbi:MAG: hypothetical protein ABIQ16_11055, partial [Polyangiaceae bacterium]